MRKTPFSSALFGLLCTLTALPAFGAEAAAPPVIRIGVTLGGHGNMHRAVFDTTREALAKHFGAERIDFRFMHTDVLSDKVNAGELDFFISTGGKSRRLMAQGSKDLLTMVTNRFPDPSRSYGGLFIVRSDAPLHTIEDLKGLRLVSNRPGGFFGFIAPMERIASLGYVHDRFFAKIRFPDTNNFDVIRYLLDDRADVAAIPSCFLEDNFAPDDPVMKAVRPIGLMGESPCLRSTPAYPNWTVSATPGIDHRLAREVMEVLLAVKPDELGVQWSVATDFTQTDQLHLALGTGIFENLEAQTFERFVREHRSLITLGVLAALMLLMHAVVLNWLVKRRTAELSRALSEQIRLQKIAQDAEARFEAQQKTGLIGQMSSMIAHELRQPLSAALAYIHGLQRFVDSGTLSKSDMQQVLSKLSGQIEKAEAIVVRVRSYAKGEGAKKLDAPIETAVKAALDAFRASGRFAGKVSYTAKANPTCRYSAMEIELAVLNLLRNAADALNASDTPSPVIRITLTADADTCRITVTDNGPRLSDDDKSRLTSPLKSEKRHGLGLGLPIVRSIAAEHGGRLDLTALPEGGVRSELILPVQEGHPHE